MVGLSLSPRYEPSGKNAFTYLSDGTCSNDARLKLEVNPPLGSFCTYFFDPFSIFLLSYPTDCLFCFKELLNRSHSLWLLPTLRTYKSELFLSLLEVTF